MAGKLKITLVAPAVWQPLLAAVLAELTEDEKAFTRAGLSALQRRHVGITPGLLAALAPAVLRPQHRGAVGGAWGEVYRRLLESLQTEGRQGGVAAGAASPALGASLTLSADPAYLLNQVAAPIVQAACCRLGRVCLLCADATGTTVDSGTYLRYESELTAAIAEVAKDTTDGSDLFWHAQADTLSSLARRREETEAAQPLLDPLAVGAFLRLRPEHKAGQDEARRSRQLALMHHQRHLRWREEGFDGIHLTHDDEDLPYRLTSESLYDRTTQLDRILNTGFLALEREPQRIRLRDVLITAYLPSPFWRTVQGDFLRACWFDFTMRAALLLRQNRLLNSEFRWLEGDRLGRGRTLVFRLDEMTAGAQAAENSRKALFRTQFRTSLRWLPRILDAAGGDFRLVPATRAQRAASRMQAGDNETLWAQCEDWAVALWRLQEEAQPPDSARPNGQGRRQLADRPEPLRAEDFVYTFHMPFLPVRKITEQNAGQNGDKPAVDRAEARQQRARLAGTLHAARPYQGGACLTWAPLEPAQMAEWCVSGYRGASDSFWENGAGDELLSPNQLAGKIVAAWLDQFLAEAPSG